MLELLKISSFVAVGMGLAALVGWIITRKKAMEDARKRERERALHGAAARNDITGVGRNGVLRLPPFGGQRNPTETFVTKRHRYTDDSSTWYELVCLNGKRDLLVEWYREGRSLKVTAGFDDENPSLSDIGLDESKLIDFDERQQGQFIWNNTTWNYRDSGENKFFEDDRGSGVGFYCWNFQSQSGDRFISVEKWAGDPDFEVYHLWLVDQDAIEVFEAGEA